jgi:hypothetical protein
MPFPDVIDNTMRTAFARCPQYFKRRHIDNLRPVEETNLDTHFGGCIAKAMEAARRSFYHDGTSLNAAIDSAIEAAEREWGAFVPPPPKNRLYPSLKTKAALAPWLEYYFETWPLDAPDALVPVKSGVECEFAVELPIAHPDTGWPLKYAGRYDMLAYADKQQRYVIVDEKTASKFDDVWMAKWDVDSQMSGYIWAVRQGLLQHGNVEQVVAQIRAVAIKKGGHEHVTLPIVRTAHAIDQWYAQLQHDINGMLRCYHTGHWDYRLAESCTSYNRPCDYMKLCTSGEPERLIDGNYKTVIWNPLERK